MLNLLQISSSVFTIASFGTGGGIRTDRRTPPREEFYSCGLSDYSLRTDLNGSWHWPTHMKVRMVRMVFE